ncbi:TetR/AcrR family transcriptional regulator [Amycolatopsis sp. CA-230715]|uniref:TetR/AcrR family transcriptional regulator n=1 Tax=Amycolatopsis sp. CA-230715 TaxID=2745196 RepID=UPI001C01757B|nr:TetR/AcrR family transcriptional regulator [Amycolatopsis sp. CA-230715]QWF77434.1 hypothetical protein HUW46_00826 [Amycolatopsis sp. CA-230715]
MSAPKARLIEAAIRLIADGGPQALQARKLAAEVGSSTMTVYTHFGGMPGLVDELAREGFRRLDANLAALGETEDPVADIAALGMAYRRTAIENPTLYAVAFGQITFPATTSTKAPAAGADEAIASFEHLLSATRRAIDAGRFRRGPAHTAAAQLWSALHGYVTIESSGFFGDQGIEEVLAHLAVTLAVGLGDTVEAAERSVRAIRLNALPGTPPTVVR